MNIMNVNHRILIAAFAGMSLFAAAQSQSDKDKAKSSTSQTESARDAASGQASGRLEQKNVVHRDLAARDIATGHATGKKSAQDDWSQKTAVSNGSPANVKPVASSSDTKAQPRVAVGDVNGDGRPDVVASKNSGHASEAVASPASGDSKVQSPRDAATGQSSGKRQHQPVTVTKATDKSPNK